MQIEVEVKGQQIKRLNSPGSVEDTLNYLTCHFTFDGSEWENTIKTAYFKNRATEKIYSSLIADDGTCTVPWESLTDKGFVEFSAAGERENYRITTGIESFYNSKTVYGGEPSEPPTPSQYDQLIALAEQTKEIAESVREDADAGEFDGPPGPQGPAGKDGQNATDEQVRTAVDAYMEEHPIQGDTEDIIKLAIKNEASGEVPVVIADSAEMGVQDIKMQGWTEQAQYEGNQLLDASVFNGVEKSGVSVSVDNGVIMASGMSETSIWIQSANFSEEDFKKLKSGNIYVKNYKSSDCNYECGIYINNITVNEGNSPKNIPEGYLETNPNNVYFYISIQAGVELKGTIQPMIYQDGDGTWEPYTGGQPSPNPEYPQEITSAGKYNEEAQKWEYEITIANEQTDPDKNQTVLLTSDRPLTKWDKLEKRNGQWGWVHKSAEVVLDGGNDEAWTLYITSTAEVISFHTTLYGGIGAMKSSLCDKYINKDHAWNEESLYGIYSDHISYPGRKYFRPPSADVETVEQWKTWLQSNPLTLWYETVEETFVPLSESEQKALNALRTYYPTTVLDNDQGCDMALTYIADTKAYIDNKVSAIQAAIVNTI